VKNVGLVNINATSKKESVTGVELKAGVVGRAL
jgi:hypothetical protein